MTVFLFVDESGHDHNESPYEVLAGVAIKDHALWKLIREIKGLEQHYFGDFYARNKVELKAKKLLKTKTYRLANQMPPINDEDLPILAQRCFQRGAYVNRLELTALAQAKIKYVAQVLLACHEAGCHIFASIIDFEAVAAQPELAGIAKPNYLRKEYSYLFERFYYFLEDLGGNDMGCVVFDELDKSQSHILLGQMSEYFVKTRKGQQRSNLIVPEPFFVHSDLTTGIHIVDLAAYILSWGFRISKMAKPSRPELQPLVTTLCNLRFLSKRVIPDIGREPVDIWSIAWIDH